MWWKRYESILERKPVPAKTALLDLLAKELDEVISEFPPLEREVEWSDPRLHDRLRDKLHLLPAVDLAFAQLLAEILILDLNHETDAIDHLFRNDGHRDACPSVLHVDALHFLWRGTLEHLYVRKEDASGTLKTRDLVEIVEKFLARFSRRQLAIQ